MKTAKIALIAGVVAVAASVAVGQRQTVNATATMAPPAASSASGAFSIHEYRYSREGDSLSIEAWGESEFLGSLVVSWKADIVDFQYADPAGGRFSAQTNLDRPSSLDTQPMFRLADLNSGEESESTWKTAEEPAKPGDGAWKVSGNRSPEEASSFLTERERQVTLFIAFVYEDALANLALNKDPKPGFEGLGPR